MKDMRRVRAHNGSVFWVSEANYLSLIRDGQVSDAPHRPVKPVEKKDNPAPTTRRRTQTKSAKSTSK